ncbi:MAG TPA: hypothetical protein VGE02_15030 [Gemmatimonadales bacterium]
MPLTPSPPAPVSAASAGRHRGILVAAIVAAIVAVAVAGCVPSPASELDQAELLLGVSDAVVALQAENAALQEQVDALEVAVARQDSLLRRVAAASGVPVTGP